MVVERLQLRGRGGHQAGRHRRIFEQVDVQVAGRRGQVAQPLELGPEGGGQLGGQGAPGELQRRPGPAHRDSQIVQELDVHVLDGALDVGLQGAQQPGQHPAERRRRGHPRGQLDVDLAGIVPGPAAGRGQRGLQGRLGGGPDAGPGGELVGQPDRLGLIAAQRGDAEPDRQRRPGRVADRHLVNDDPGHRFLVRIHGRLLTQHADRPDHRGQRPHPDHRPELLAQRACGQSVELARPARGAGPAAPAPAGARLGPRRVMLGQHRAVAPGEPDLGAAAGADLLEGQPGPVQPPVEGI